MEEDKYKRETWFRIQESDGHNFEMLSKTRNVPRDFDIYVCKNCGYKNYGDCKFYNLGRALTCKEVKLKNMIG